MMGKECQGRHAGQSQAPGVRSHQGSLGVDQTRREEGEAKERKQRREQRQASCVGCLARRTFIPRNEEGTEQRDDGKGGDIERKDGAPVSKVDEQATKNQAKRHAKRYGDGAHRQGTQLGVGVEHAPDEGKRHGDVQAGTEPHEPTHGDSNLAVRSEATCDRGEGKDASSQDERPLDPPPVAQRSREQHRRRKDQVVRRHHPLLRHLVGPKRDRDGRKRNVEGRRVGKAHERPKTQAPQGPPDLPLPHCGGRKMTVFMADGHGRHPLCDFM